MMRSVALVGLVSFVGLMLTCSTAPSRAAEEPENCHQTAILDELHAINPQEMQSILQKAAAMENAAGIFWRIEKPGTDASYLFGTVHVVSATLQSISPAVREAIAQSRSVALETSEMQRDAIGRVAAFASPLMLASEPVVDKVLDEEEQRILEREMRRSGFPAQFGARLKPWAITLLLGRSDCQAAAAQKGLLPLDMIVADEAARRGIEVQGLESMLEQYQSLAAIPNDVQAAWLKSSIALVGREDEMAATVAELYRFRRIGALWDIARLLTPRSGLDDAAAQSFKEQLVDRRNAKMLERVLPLLAQGKVFVAVGAMHLIGPQGLVALLRAHGFTVTQVE